MRRISVLFGVFAMVVGLALPAAATQTKNFRAHLSGDGEIPAVDSAGQGQAIFRVDGNTVNYKLIVANTENVTQAHIHCGGADVNAPVLVFLFGFVGGGVSSNGVLAEGSFTAADFRPTCGFTSVDELVNAMATGGAYVNVHTVANPGGEIRGQIH